MYPPHVRSNTQRFTFQGESFQWAPCGEGERISQQVEEGSRTSVSDSYKQTSNVVWAILIPIVIPKVGHVGTAYAAEDTTVTFAYSKNQMTEQAKTTEAVATIGGGSCPPDAPLLITDRYYDSTFGTLLFPTLEAPVSNVEGSVEDARGRPAAHRKIVVTRIRSKFGRQREHIVTYSDPNGKYRLFLEQGKYRIVVKEAFRGKALSQPQVFHVVSTKGRPLKLKALVIGGRKSSEKRINPSKQRDLLKERDRSRKLRRLEKRR